MTDCHLPEFQQLCSKFEIITRTRTTVGSLLFFRLDAGEPRGKRLQRILVFIRDQSIQRRFKVGEHREPYSGPVVLLAEDAIVGERVIIQEETRCYVEGDEHVDRVMFVRRQDEENCEDVADPAQSVEHRDPTRSI